MRIGLIARADNRGLGQQTWEFFRHMKPAKTMVVNCPSAAPLPLHLERFPGATVVDRFPEPHDFAPFLQDIDVVFTAETPYSYALFSMAEERGIRSVLQYNFEFLDYIARPKLPRPTVFAAPSLWRYRELGVDNKCFLPVPIATDRFPERTSHWSTARNFLHVVGRPAIHDRNGTADLLAALKYVKSEIRVTITCQDPSYVSGLVSEVQARRPSNVDLVIDNGDVANYWDNYTGQDVLVMPRRFGGLCLPANEALGAGMPVIMPDIDPNNTWLPTEWLLRATKTSQFMAKVPVDVYTTEPALLAAKIDELATDESAYSKACLQAAQLRDQRSWEALKPQYEKVLGEL